MDQLSLFNESMPDQASSLFYAESAEHHSPLLDPEYQQYGEFVSPHIRIPRRHADSDGHFAIRCGTCAAWVAQRGSDGWCGNPRCASHYQRAADALISGIHCRWQIPVPVTQNCGS